MVDFEFKNLSFEKSEETGEIKVGLMKIFYSYLDFGNLNVLFDKKDKHKIIFPEMSEREALNKFNRALFRAFDCLQSSITGNKAVYIHQNSGIPLIGGLQFGIVDRGTNIIELKPITGCNIDCVFCSVSSGKKIEKETEFVVEKNYLVQEAKKLIEFKDADIDIFINTHGEPLLYSEIVELVRDLRKIERVKTIAIITNGTLFSKKLIDDLVNAGLNQINVSINAIDSKNAKKLAGCDNYNIGNVIEMISYASKKIKIYVAPVWINGMNDSDIKDVIEFARSINAKIGVQNYMRYKTGKRIAKEITWKKFFDNLSELGKNSGVKLDDIEHTLFETKQLIKPFKKGDVIKVDLVCVGRIRGEVLGVANDRVISIMGCDRISGRVKVKIIRTKDNIFSAISIQKNILIIVVQKK